MLPSYFPMDNVKRCLMFLLFAVSCLTFAILCAAMFTQEWTIAKPVRTGLNVSVRVPNPSDLPGNRFQGLVYFGLFRGKKILNYGFGNRVFDLKIVCVAKLRVCMYSSKENATERIKHLHENLFIKGSSSGDAGKAMPNNSLLSFGLWAATVSFVCLSAMFALIAAAFSIVSAVNTSAEVITGLVGLYLWNILGGACSASAVFTWSTQFFTKFRKNVMTLEEIQELWTSEYRACMGYSFYLTVLVIILFLFNIGLLTLVIKQPWVARKLKADLRKKLSNPSYIARSPASSIHKKRQF